MSNKRIMVVDDEPLVLKSVRMVLIRAGYAVDVASSGAEALQKLEAGTFDLVVTDWKMPFMKGDIIAREIRKRHPLMPVLLLTGSVLEAPPSGFDGVLFKPFSADELREIVTALAGEPSA
ncbi:MAG: response regulator [Verrucomicrobiota bacterium]